MPNIKPIQPDIGEGSWQNIVHHAPEGASQDFLQGALLINSSGQLIEETSSTSAAYTGLIGVAFANAKGVQASDVAYCPLNPDTTTFAVSVDDAPVSNNAPGTGSLAASALFGQYALVKDAASGHWYLNDADTTHKAVTVIDFIDPPGTVNGRVRVRFLHAVTLID